MAQYIKQKFDEAGRCFSESAKYEQNRIELNPSSLTTPSLVMGARAKELKINPPKDGWDGTYVMTTK